MKSPQQRLQEFGYYLNGLGYDERVIRRVLQMVKAFDEQHPKALHTPQGIREEEVLNYYHYLEERPHKHHGGGLSAKTIHANMYGIRLYFNYLEAIGELGTHPMSGLWFKSPEHRPRAVVSVEQIEKLYQVARSYKERCLLGLYYGCGLRKQEGEDVNIADVHFREGLLYVRKGKFKKRRVVPMARRVQEDLKGYYYQERKGGKASKVSKANKEETALVLNETGTRMRGHSYLTLLYELIQRTGDEELKALSIGLHSLRHSIGTHLLSNGVSLEYVRDFLGHSHIETTQYYTRVSDQQVQQLNQKGA